MNMIDSVFDTVKQFTKSPKYVTIDFTECYNLSEKIKSELNYNKQIEGIPSVCVTDKSWTNSYNEQYINFITYELMAGSVNYQYWYGSSSIRPNGSSSVLMYSLLDQSFEETNKALRNLLRSDSIIDMTIVSDIFKKKMIKSRFPLIEQRCKHIDELFEWRYYEGYPYAFRTANSFAEDLAKESKDEIDIEKWLSRLITTFPGFSSDIFLKRASLFFMQLYRKAGWFKNQIHKLPIPADYQIPKMLKKFGCIKYNDLLLYKVENSELIPAGSLMECEIRAASIWACKFIAEKAGYSGSDIDYYLWLKRKECVDNFHLTITTDY